MLIGILSILGIVDRPESVYVIKSRDILAFFPLFLFVVFA